MWNTTQEGEQDHEIGPQSKGKQEVSRALHIGVLTGQLNTGMLEKAPSSLTADQEKKENTTTQVSCCKTMRTHHFSCVGVGGMEGTLPFSGQNTAKSRHQKEREHK